MQPGASATPPLGESRISVLPENLINQIAAGEVVERPASVIKELVENSLDAGASRIDVELWNGGLERILVRDDGIGMSQADIPMSLVRHATSKIHVSSDLEQIETFGFRGEALASIASVARVEVTSREVDADTAYAMVVEHGQVTPLRPLGAPKGTSIAVTQLFERIPARQKFMRSASTEFSHCARIIKDIALGNPETEFHLHHQGRAVASYVTRDWKTRFEECFRPDWKPLEVSDHNDDLLLRALLSPTTHVSDRMDLQLYINRRCVKHRSIQAAVRQAYASTLGPHHEPSGALFLEIRRDWVDVNVHPQKTEVRCFQQESLYGWIVSVIRKAIGQHPSLLQVSEPPTPPRLEPQIETRTPSSSVSSSVQPPYPGPIQNFSIRPIGMQAAPVIPAVESRQPSDRALETMPLFDSRTDLQPEFKYLGQLRSSYLICESSEGLVLVDQHALHEKIQMERLEALWNQNEPAAVALLIPKIVRLPADLREVAAHFQSALATLGLEYEPYSDGDVGIRSLPAGVEDSEIHDLVKNILVSLQQQEGTPIDIVKRSRRPLLATMACHQSVRANQRLTPEKAQALLAKLSKIEQGWTCPHGRPVLFELSYAKIETYFERTGF